MERVNSWRTPIWDHEALTTTQKKKIQSAPLVEELWEFFMCFECVYISYLGDFFFLWKKYVARILFFMYSYFFK